MSLEHAVTSVITPSQYHELPSATQPDYENCITVKKNNSDGLVHTYHVERDTLFPLVWAALVEKINNDFNIDADSRWNKHDNSIINSDIGANQNDWDIKSIGSK